MLQADVESLLFTRVQLVLGEREQEIGPPSLLTPSGRLSALDGSIHDVEHGYQRRKRLPKLIARARRAAHRARTYDGFATLVLWDCSIVC